MRRATKDDIIYVNLNKLEIIATSESKQSFINRPCHIPMMKQEGLNPIIPSPSRLFKPIQSFMKLVYSMRVFGVLETWGLLDIDLFFYETI